MPDSARPRPSRLNVLYVAFFLSGMSGLIYETVWIRMLTRYLGSTTAAVSTVLAVFMGGLALGSFLGGRMADRVRRLILVYAGLELAIAAAAMLCSFLILAVLGHLYVALAGGVAGHGWQLHVLRATFAASFLLLPTLLMGATLPLLVRHASLSGRFQTGLARLYAANTFGAMTGVLVAGFVLIGALGEQRTLYTALALNLLAALMAWSLAKKPATAASTPASKPPASEPTGETITPYEPAARATARLALFFSGFSALAYEVLWSRFLILPLRTSIYSFSFMLAMTLFGIALGSQVSARLNLPARRPLAAFALSQLLIGTLTLAGLLAYEVIGVASWGFMILRPLHFLAAGLMVLPVAICYGWQFPVAVRCVVSKPALPGRETGSAYALNTLGTILGSLAGGFAIIPLLGTAKGMILLSLANLALGFALMRLAPKKERGSLPAMAAGLICCAALAVVFVGNPFRDAMYKRVQIYKGLDAEMYAFYEGTAGTTAPAGALNDPLKKALYINGIGMSALVSETKIMAHLPLDLAENPSSICIICFGMGTTLRSATLSPHNLDTIVAVDIVPRVFDCFHFFHPDADEITALPQVQLVPDDGRNYLLMHDQRFDVITIDPAPPIYSSGTVNLYTHEFLELCKSRITDTGVVCLWLPPAAATDLPMIMRTFVDVFPGASVWRGHTFPGMFLMGGHRDMGLTDAQVARVARRLAAIPDMAEWDPELGDPEVLAGLYLAGPEELAELVADYPMVTDDRPYTEFPLFRGGLAEDAPMLYADNFFEVLLRHKLAGTP